MMLDSPKSLQSPVRGFFRVGGFQSHVHDAVKIQRHETLGNMSAIEK